MKTLFVSDISLVQMAKRHEELLICDRKRLIHALSEIGVDAIELPAMKSLRQDAIVNRISAAEAKGCQIRIPVGYTEESVAAAWESVAECENVCLQVEYPLSTVQLEYGFHQKAASAVASISQLTTLAKEKCKEVEFIARDVTRADRELIAQVCDILKQADVTALTLCDDTEAVMPEEMAELVRFVRQHWSAALTVCVSDRVGMGLASAIASIVAGADGVKTSIRGDGALSLVSLARLIHVRGDGIGFSSCLNVTAAEQIISGFLNHKTSVAAPSTEYTDAHQISLDAGSTMSDVSEAVQALGYDLSDEDCGKVYEECKRVSAKKGVIGERELEAIIAGAAMAVPSTYHVESYVTNSGNIMTSTAQIVLTKNGERLNGVSIGDGPIDAAFHAIEQVIGHHYELEDFQIHAVTQGREALGSALVKLRANGRLYSGNGVSTDIVGAAIRAYVNALNKIVYEEG